MKLASFPDDHRKNMSRKKRKIPREAKPSVNTESSITCLQTE